MEIRVIDKEETFALVKDKWNSIVEKMKDATPFQTWEWNYHWWKEWGTKEHALLVLEAFEGRDSYGFAPIVIHGGRATFIGDKHFDYGLFICAERKREVVSLFLEKLTDICRKHGLILSLQCVPIVSHQFALFKEIAEKMPTSLLREQVATANVCLSEYEGLDGYLRAVSASLRKKAIRPCLRANVEFRIEPFTEELWTSIEGIYENRQEMRVGKSTLHWARPVVQKLYEAGILKISMLYHQQNPVAFLIFFEKGSVDYVWLTAFKKTDNLQLGHYVRYCLMERAFSGKVKTVDMMRGAYEYKKQWDCNVSYNYEFILFRSKLQKLGYALKMKIRKKARDIVYRNKTLKRIYAKIAK